MKELILESSVTPLIRSVRFSDGRTHPKGLFIDVRGREESLSCLISHESTEALYDWLGRKLGKADRVKRLEAALRLIVKVYGDQNIINVNWPKLIQAAAEALGDAPQEEKQTAQEEDMLPINQLWYALKSRNERIDRLENDIRIVRECATHAGLRLSALESKPVGPIGEKVGNLTDGTPIYVGDTIRHECESAGAYLGVVVGGRIYDSVEVEVATKKTEHWPLFNCRLVERGAQGSK